MTTQANPSNIIKEGWCIKLGAIFKTWRKRWFILEGKTLRYYVRKDGAFKGAIELKPEYVIEKYPQCKKQPAFSINTENRLYQIVAPSEVEVDEWIQVLNEAKDPQTDENNVKANDKVTLDDFEVIKTLGKGSYGKVTLVRNKNDQMLYALKSISKEVLQKHDLIESTKRERDTLMTIHHPFLVSAHYSFQNDTHIFLAQEFVPGGDLFSYLGKNSTIDEDQTRYYTAMLLLAIGELHKHGIIHRDLKPDNILIDKLGYLKITDFGLVKFDIKDGKTTTTFCGTPEYIPPEIILGQPYGRSVDWWSLGILVYRMLFGCPTFYHPTLKTMYYQILNDPPDYPEESDISEEAFDLINALLAKKPEERLGSSERDYLDIKEHAWFSELDWDELLQKKIPMEYIPEVSSIDPTNNFDDEFTAIAPAVTPQDPTLITSDTQHAFQDFTLINDE